jgi:hypothetical protein
MSNFAHDSRGPARLRLDSLDRALYFAFGEVDFYIIFDVPDNISAAALSVVANQSGVVTSKIIVLITADEMDEAFKKAMNIHFLPPGE